MCRGFFTSVKVTAEILQWPSIYCGSSKVPIHSGHGDNICRLSKLTKGLYRVVLISIMWCNYHVVISCQWLFQVVELQCYVCYVKDQHNPYAALQVTNPYKTLVDGQCGKTQD